MRAEADPAELIGLSDENDVDPVHADGYDYEMLHAAPRMPVHLASVNVPS